MSFVHIVAVNEAQVIGRDGDIPWKIKGDLKRFKTLTMGHTVIMGRKTFESIGTYAPLKGRYNIVLSSRPKLEFGEGQEIVQGQTLTFDDHTRLSLVSSLNEARLASLEEPRVFIIGGEGLYKQTLEETDEIFLTKVHNHESGDTFYPGLDPEYWEITSEIPLETHTYYELERKR